MASDSKTIVDTLRARLKPPSTSALAEAEQAWQADALFAGFMRHLPGLAWLKRLDGTFVYANEAAVRAFAPNMSTLVGKTNADVLPPDVAKQCDLSDAQAAQSPGGIEVLEKYIHADGSERIVLVNKFPIAGVSGATQFIGAIALDITERRRIEETLRLNEERFRLATEAGKIGIWEWDIVRNEVTWSSTIYTMHGLKPGEFDGTVEGFAELTHPEDRGGIVWIYTHAKVLRESEARFAKAFNSSPLTLTLSSLVNGKLLEVNETFCKLSGYSREEAIGRTRLNWGYGPTAPIDTRSWTSCAPQARCAIASIASACAMAAKWWDCCRPSASKSTASRARSS